MLLLDQRGTGLSSTITAATLARQGNATKQAEYMKNFRADNIVRDCEAIRRCLTAGYSEDKRKWSVIGQSFGGFCAVTYFSMLYALYKTASEEKPLALTCLSSCQKSTGSD